MILDYRNYGEKMMNTVLFDLDGTLLPMNLDVFIKVYFDALGKHFTNYGYDYETILNAVITGTKAMLANDGKQTNESVFWQQFEASSSLGKEDVQEAFEHFYTDVFPTLNAVTRQNENMIKSVRLLKEKGYTLLLTTNPMFPKEAVEARLHWAGLEPDLFTMMTSYENCCATKPNVLYYEEVIKKQNLKIEECMMVGNDSKEDGVIETLGIPLYLIEDDLIHREETPLQSKWHGSSASFYAFVEKLAVVE